MSREKFQPGMLVFLPQSMMSYSDIWVIARVWDDEQTGRRRCVCHRIDRDKGVPMTCPDPRCEGKGMACCAITTNGGWTNEVEPLTKEAIELFSTEEPLVLDRAYAEKCLAFVPRPGPKRSKEDFAKFLDSLMGK